MTGLSQCCSCVSDVGLDGGAVEGDGVVAAAAVVVVVVAHVHLLWAVQELIGVHHE